MVLMPYLCARPDVLPRAQNNPQKNKYGLYNEGVRCCVFLVVGSCAYGVGIVDDGITVYCTEK